MQYLANILLCFFETRQTLSNSKFPIAAIYSIELIIIVQTVLIVGSRLLEPANQKAKFYRLIEWDIYNLSRSSAEFAVLCSDFAQVIGLSYCLTKHLI